jgi:putative membrane protein
VLELIPEPWLFALLAASGVLYAIGLRALWRSAGAGRGIAHAAAARFALGWAAMVVALASPLETLGDRLFSAHMVQHELLMVVAAPLLVLGRPLEAWAWALPAGVVRALAGVGRSRIVRRAWNAATEPVGAWCLHAIALWAWHVPALFDAALASEAVHAAQHASFLGTALLFWWAVLGRGVRRPDGASLASLFTTMVHTGALGALLTFAPHPWYAHYAATPWLTPLEDQQLGGLVMWVPGGFAYAAAGLAIVGSWLTERAPARVR